jgi:hypothetical protein
MVLFFDEEEIRLPILPSSGRNVEDTRLKQLRCMDKDELSADAKALKRTRSAVW